MMTDQKGTAYFTDIEPGTYVISNVIRNEGSETASLWNCEVKVEAADISMVMDRPYQISNTKDMKPAMLKQTKCFSDEKPLPSCPGRSASRRGTDFSRWFPTLDHRLQSVPLRF